MYSKHISPLLFGIILLTVFSISPGHGQVFKTQDEALSEVFSDADTVIRKTLFLDDEQISRIQTKSKSRVDNAIISYYVGYKDNRMLRFAYFEDSIVRTKKAVLLILITPQNIIEKIEVLAFYEPQDYLPISKWFQLFTGHKLSDQLMPGKAIHAVTGATLSVQAFAAMARRALAIHELIREEIP